jgi:hypothetical protein
MSTAQVAITDIPNARAIGRLSLVTGIQALGVLTVFALIWFGGGSEGTWQRDCSWIAGLLGIGTLAVLAGTQIWIFPNLKTTAEAARIAEALISAAFVVNTVACSLAVARTGGPVTSLFGPLIPIQLSGILLLKQQKENTSEKIFKMPWIYAAISITLWLLSHWLWQNIDAFFKWTFEPIKISGRYSTSAAFLTAIGMAFTAAAYILPTTEWFRNFATRLYARIESQQAKG